VALTEELTLTAPTGERTVHDIPEPNTLLDEVKAAAELRRAQVIVGPPTMVGSSRDISTWTVLTPLDDALSMTVVAFAVGSRTIVAVPTEERVTDLAI
jgi:hypothetical protein